MRKFFFLTFIILLFINFSLPALSANVPRKNNIFRVAQNQDTPIFISEDNNQVRTDENNGETVAQWMGETLREKIFPKISLFGGDDTEGSFTWKDLTKLPFKTWALIFFLTFIAGSMLSTLFGFLANISIILSFVCMLLGLATWFLG